ncbi:asparagine synthase (glutamine-hydrolyzing) [Sphingomonas sp.]|uniref:asparagine synthase (glutamine-hydrolyzing) n=1 Tax=Sphingomonas sp. TaxID=28214 RepID=UPI00182985F1|nr:asparagine synthase (glutamine-hydrolyzing) [Sphingomonas sp.]MBA3512071.1 asparagine synthase (glutamine-hydrolyzing) [Sphingomonas sp.]
MCGIAGIISSSRLDERDVRRLIDPLVHRGPDDEGVWIDSEAGVGLGHRRLAIVDLSPAGHQPMESADGRYVITYNAEIYNHSELRKELEAAGNAPPGGWRGHSDTETFLECVSAWGLADTLPRIVGMFAFALWDRKQRTLHLVRDRFGEKPLYYGWAGKDFVFASELKAIRAHPRFDGQIDRRALRLFAARTYIPAPLSIYRRLFKLEPGCVLTITPEAARTPLDAPPRADGAAGGIHVRRYWSYRDVVRRGLEQRIGDEREALDGLEQVLARAITDQSVADVPVGAFLSGGVDSSTIVALYQKYSSTPVRTFTIGFEEAAFNEAEDARTVAAHLGTVHSERYLTVQEARDVIPLLPSMYDEPFADSSQIPTHLVSRFARDQVTVALTGDGGDELFAGYNRHFTAPQLWQQLRRLPRPLRSAIGSSLSRVPSQFWSGAVGLLSGRHQPLIGGKIQKGLRLAGSVRNFDELYSSFIDEWGFEESPVRGGHGALRAEDMDCDDEVPDTVRTMYFDAVSYLPGDILCKVDRASMAVSLETRVPFLDHRVAEFAARIPLDMKVRGGRGKHILRELLYREVPSELFERPKVGFAIPVGEWIKGPLRPWAEDLLDASRMAGDGWFDPAIVQRRWQDHLGGRRDSTPALWAVLMFQSWVREQRSALSAAA